MHRRTVLSAAAAALLPAAAAANTWPTRPLRLVVPFPPGSASDILARSVAARMSETLGQTVVVENRPGAGGTIGTDAVAKAAPDGHTLLMATAAHTITAATFERVPFDARRDFAPVARLIATPLLLVVHPEVRANTVAELVALARAEPGRISFASSGNGTSHHMASEFLKLAAGIDILHVPYRGSAPAQVDLVAGRVQMMFDNIVAVLGHVRAGRLRPLAVSSLARSAILPEIPTVAESGFPGFEVNAWFGIMAPAGTPREVIDRLTTASIEAVRRPETAERLVSEGATIVAEGPEAFASFVNADLARWERVARDGNIRVES
mgnify:CR=1 FL=1